jgi:hypothetical protein
LSSWVLLAYIPSIHPLREKETTHEPKTVEADFQ